MHAAAIAATSQQLDALINGGMEESEKRCARIEDVRVDDFIRFCEYAYRGDYAVPPWEKVLLQEETPPQSKPPPELIQHSYDDEPQGSRGLMSKKAKKSAKMGKLKSASWGFQIPEPPISPEVPREEPCYAEMQDPEPPSEMRPPSRAPLRTQFNSRNYINDSSPKSLILQSFEPMSNNTVDQNFTPVLLAHARLYCFAHVRLISPLKALTLQKLHKTLLDFKLFAERVGDVIELSRYAYSSPDLPDRSEDGTLDDLRKLVLEYIVCEIDTIGKYDEFVKYIEEGGEFVADFWRMVRGYVA